MEQTNLDWQRHTRMSETASTEIVSWSPKRQLELSASKTRGKTQRRSIHSHRLLLVTEYTRNRVQERKASLTGQLPISEMAPPAAGTGV